MFDRLSVFAGPFTIEAAEAIVAGDGVDEWEVLDGVLALVDKSLVVADEDDGGDALSPAGDDAPVRPGQPRRRRYRRRRTATGTPTTTPTSCLSRRPQLHGSGRPGRARRHRARAREHPRRVAPRGRRPQLVALRGALQRALHSSGSARGRTSEGASWAAELLGGPIVDPRARIVALGFAASVANPTEPGRRRGDGRGRRRPLGDRPARRAPLVAMTVMNLGAMMQGRTEAAIAGCEQVLELAAEEPAFIRASCSSTTIAVLAICRAFDRLDALERELDALAEQLDNGYIRREQSNSMAPIIHMTDPDGPVSICCAATRSTTRSATLTATARPRCSSPSTSCAPATLSRPREWARRSLGVVRQGRPQLHRADDRRDRRDRQAPLACRRGRAPRRAARPPRPQSTKPAPGRDRRRRPLRGVTPPSARRPVRSALRARLALDEADMIALAFTQLDAITQTHDRSRGCPITLPGGLPQGRSFRASEPRRNGSRRRARIGCGRTVTSSSRLACM